MFTGIVRSIGSVTRIDSLQGDIRLWIDPGMLDVDPALGDSIAVNGVCLTVVSLDAGQLAFDVSVESLSLTTLKDTAAGSRVNLEPAATPTTALGGHIVSGHVDTLARVVERRPDARSVRFTFAVPGEIGRAHV